VHDRGVGLARHERHLVRVRARARARARVRVRVRVRARARARARARVRARARHERHLLEELHRPGVAQADQLEQQGAAEAAVARFLLDAEVRVAVLVARVIGEVVVARREV